MAVQNFCGIIPKKLELESWLQQQIRQEKPLDLLLATEPQLTNRDFKIKNYTTIRNNANTENSNKCSEVIALLYDDSDHCIEEASEILPNHTNLLWLKYFNFELENWTYICGIYAPPDQPKNQDYIDGIYEVLHQNLKQIENLNAAFILTGDLNCPFKKPYQEVEGKNYERLTRLQRAFNLTIANWLKPAQQIFTRQRGSSQSILDLTLLPQYNTEILIKHEITNVSFNSDHFLITLLLLNKQTPQQIPNENPMPKAPPKYKWSEEGIVSYQKTLAPRLLQWMINTTEADKSDPTTFINEITTKLTDLILLTCKETLQKVKAPAAEEKSSAESTDLLKLSRERDKKRSTLQQLNNSHHPDQKEIREKLAYIEPSANQTWRTAYRSKKTVKRRDQIYY